MSMKKLNRIRTTSRSKGAKVRTVGLKDHQIAAHLSSPSLKLAIDRADANYGNIEKRYANRKLHLEDERKVTSTVSRKFVQFYDLNTVNPYVPIGAAGPFIVTSYGSVLYDTGGYGMLGYGHGPQKLLDNMNEHQVMANIMTPSFSQDRFGEAITREIGHTRGKNVDGTLCPYEGFAVLNSGSESVSLAMRVADVDAKNKTKIGQKTALISLETSFHGRTERPAHASHSSRPAYIKHLKSFEQVEVPLFTVKPNDIEDLNRVWDKVKAEGYHVEMMLMEPVMGEGNPGEAITRQFYDAARKITKDNKSLLLIDSIQAGIRTRGTLSICDYPGFQDAEAPDFETYSKALNGGQFPMSVLAFGPGVGKIYQRGLYGNTMTTNPRGLDVASTVLESITPELRANIVNQGKNWLETMDHRLRDAFPDVVEKNTGCGLLTATHINPDFKAYGHPLSLEVLCRENGLGVIHGGKNALRYTPVFDITKEEIDLVADIVSENIETLKKHKASGDLDLPASSFDM